MTIHTKLITWRLIGTIDWAICGQSLIDWITACVPVDTKYDVVAYITVVSLHDAWSVFLLVEWMFKKWPLMESAFRCNCFAPQLEEINVNFSRSPLKIDTNLSRPVGKVICSTITFVQLSQSFLPRSADLTNCPEGSVLHLCWSGSALSCHCVQITPCKQSRSHANQYPTSIKWNNCSVLRSWAFAYGGVENNWSVTRWHLRSLACEASSLTQELCGH